MTTLTRRVRLFIAANDEREATDALNGYAGTPTPLGLGAHLELDVTCGGVVDPSSGYLINITEIDDATRRVVPRILREALVMGTTSDTGRVMIEINDAISQELPVPVTRLCLHLTPTAHIALRPSDMNTPITHVLKTQSFSFAASHRLHNPTLSDDENRRVYGKCNNPNGHGHNYRVDVSIRVPIGFEECSFERLEEVVGEVIIDRYDHKHLNLDTDDFDGTPASVENITARCVDLLSSCIPERLSGAALERVRVWETDKTYATIELSG
ncbi:MAG: 6-carboxytetrahydropterin synthase [Phycisphaerales bacterium JB043]